MTTNVLMASGHDPAPEPHTIAFAEGEPARLNSDDRIYLSFFHRYTPLRPTGARRDWAVSTAEYIYELLDEDGLLIVGFHWHPRGRSPATWPHLHMPRSSPYSLGQLHPPTGRISVEAVIRFAIRELKVRPLRERWELDLESSERQFQRRRTWS